MFSIITKAIWVLWNTFAPESAKVVLQSVAKEAMKIFMLLIVTCLVAAGVFFGGSYYFAQWLQLYIHYTVLCYLIAIPICLLLTITGLYFLFRYIIRTIIKRAQLKGGAILNTFSLKK